MSAAVLSVPPLSYVVMVPSLVLPMKPPMHTTSCSRSRAEVWPMLLRASETRKLVNSGLSSVIMGQWSYGTAAAERPSPCRMWFITWGMSSSPEWPRALARTGPANIRVRRASSRASRAISRWDSTISRHRSRSTGATKSSMAWYVSCTNARSGSAPRSALLPCSKTTSVRERRRPSSRVSGAEKTATTLAPADISLILSTMVGMEAPISPMALPPNFATVRSMMFGPACR